MSALKIFLIGGAVLMLVAVCFGVYVWYQLQGLDNHTVREQKSEENTQVAEEATTTATELESEPAPTPAGPTVTEKTVPDSPQEDIVIDERELTADQVKLLNRLGVDTNTIVITGEMVACAEAKLGVARVDEIIAGATPSMLEGLSVLPCLN